MIHKPRASAAGKPVKILIVDDHPMVREGLAVRISKHRDMQVCGEAADVADAVKLVRETQPDLIIVDISLKDSSGLELIKQVKAQNNEVKMLVSSMHDEQLYAERALRAGAMGYINKQAMPESVIDAIRQVMAGKIYVSSQIADRLLSRSLGRRPWDAGGSPEEVLSDRELEVFGLIGRGLSTREIAGKLGRSVHTIESHRENIKQKLKIARGVELNHRAVQWVLGKQ